MKKFFYSLLTAGTTACAALIVVFLIHMGKTEAFDDSVSIIAPKNVTVLGNTDDGEQSIGPRIICWGDSITYGLGSGEGAIMTDGGVIDITDWAYTDTLAYYTGLDVYNLGVSGETSYEIAIRQGGLKMYISKAVIVKAGKKTRVSITDESGNPVELGNFNGYGIDSEEPENVVYIDGAPYQLTNEGGIWYISFYGNDVTGSVKIKKNSQVMTKAAYDMTGSNESQDVLVIQMGSNGGWEDYDMLIAQYNAMIVNSGIKNYIIIGDTDNPHESVESDRYQDMKDAGLYDTGWETALSEAFGSHFINMRTYMLDNAFAVTGLEPTVEDYDDINHGNVPMSIKSDYTHMNSYGYYVIGKAVYEKGTELGYW